MKIQQRGKFEITNSEGKFVKAGLFKEGDFLVVSKEIGELKRPFELIGKFKEFRTGFFSLRKKLVLLIEESPGEDLTISVPLSKIINIKVFQEKKE